MGCRLSNSLLGILNFMTLVASLGLLVLVVWLGANSTSSCERVFHRPAIVIAVFLVVASIAGVLGSCCRVTALLWLYLAVAFLLIVATIGLTAWVFLVTNEAAGRVVSGQGYGHYRLGDYSHWLQRRVEDEANWGKIRVCLMEAQVCDILDGALMLKNLNGELSGGPPPPPRSLSPIQVGCCHPPPDCGISGDLLVAQSSMKNSSDGDCSVWNGKEDKLCYDCRTCKAGVLENVRHNWRNLAIANVVVIVFLVVVYSIGCCAFRNNRNDSRRYWRT
ncbi:Tetraspanin-8 [Nymphaea thermarum]|nr:Tetraspanin-8 [Nymphaea thermarum]